MDVCWDGTWVEIAEGGLALGMGLDRLLMLRKGIPDIRLLRSADPRVSGQMTDLAPWWPVLAMPPVRRDLSVAVDADEAAEELGDRVREALGPDADAVEEVAVLAETGYEQLPAPAVARLGIAKGGRTCWCGWSCVTWSGPSPTRRPTGCATASTRPCTGEPATSGQRDRQR